MLPAAAALAEELLSEARAELQNHTAGRVFQHIAPDSDRIGYAAERALFISAQLSTDAVSVFRKVLVLIRLWKQQRACEPVWPSGKALGW